MPLDQVFFQVLSQLSPFATLAGMSITAAAFTRTLSFQNYQKYPQLKTASIDFCTAFSFFIGGIGLTTLNSLITNNDLIGASLIVFFWAGIFFLCKAAYNLFKGL